MDCCGNGCLMLKKIKDNIGLVVTGIALNLLVQECCT
jgi:hypothetical protein